MEWDLGFRMELRRWLRFEDWGCLGFYVLGCDCLLYVLFDLLM